MSAARNFTSRGLKETSPEALNATLRLVLENMEPMVYGDAASGLTAAEQVVLKEGGLILEPLPGSDPLADAAITYAAIITRSLSTREVSQRLGLTPSRVRQMIADHSLYSFLMDGNRYIPVFQFGEADRLIPNIIRVNKVLNSRLHPVEVYNWYHLPHVDLFLNQDIDAIVSPLDWLKEGQDAEILVRLAARM